MKRIFVLSLLSVIVATSTSNAQSVFDKGNVFAWCVVPFDSTERTPQERIAMLKELGFTAYAYDWRNEHIASAAEEWELAKSNGIRVSAVWMWIDNNADQIGKLSPANQQILASIKQTNLKTQIWIGVSNNFFDGLDETQKLKKGVELVGYLNGITSDLGCKIALYNHGDWFGEPANQIRIIEASGLSDVGIVYNFHHAHEQLDRYEQIINSSLPYLWSVNLNGMKSEGPKILPLGQGNKEADMMLYLKKVGFSGSIGILGHVEEADVKYILRGNLEGMKLLLLTIDPKAASTY